MKNRVSFVIKICLLPLLSSYYKLFIFSSYSQEPLGQFQLTWNKASYGIQVCSNKGPHPFPRGDNNGKVKIKWQYSEIFRNSGPI